MDPNQTPQPDSAERFMRLYADHHRSIFAYIFALVGDQDQAEEVLQDTSVTLWRRCDDFTAGTNFMAWTKAVALNQVRNWRRSQRRDRLVFSDEMMEQLAEDQAAVEEETTDAFIALRHCMAKLRDVDRDLIERCYADKTSFKQVAAELNRPANTVYKALNRVRLALADCIRTQLDANDGTSPTTAESGGDR